MVQRDISTLSHYSMQTQVNKARRYRGLWLFTASFVLDKQLHLCCLLKYEGKKKYQSKVPSINKLCFLFPLSPFSPVLYLLVFEFSIVIVNHVKGLGPFIDLCRCDYYSDRYAKEKSAVLNLRNKERKREK